MAKFGHSDRQLQHHIYKYIVADKMQMSVTFSLSKFSMQ